MKVLFQATVNTVRVYFSELLCLVNLPTVAALNRADLFVTFLIGWVGGNVTTRNTAQLWVCQLWPELAIAFDIVHAIDLHWVWWEILQPNCFLIAPDLARQQTFVLLPSYFQSYRLASPETVMQLTIDVPVVKMKWQLFNYMYMYV